VYSIALIHAGEGGYVAVPVRYDSANEELKGDISELGTYLLGKLDGYNTDFTEDPQLPSTYLLHQNSPNPFNPSTSIAFELPDADHVKLAVYNILGQKVITLVDEYLGQGSHSVRWDGGDSRGNSVSSGIYFYRLQTDEFIDTKRMVLLK
ncbi:MAG: T9SS type A sorting domain-containing protein, partial [candidate division Zixibacteria bacterium]|nr:T9SS type A sorting domain-containing protein [candidate division Zixibacteria bacterium]